MDLLRSLPLGLYLEKPITWLHKLDPRVKLIWLMSFLVSPVLASSIWRLILVAILIILTFTASIPLRVWKKQMGWLLMFCTLIFLMSTAIAPDGLAINYQPRLPKDELAFAQETANLPPKPESKTWKNFFGLLGKETPEEAISQTPKLTELPQPTSYSYIIFQQNPITITRHSLDLGVRIATLLFTVIYSTNLYLLTTASEEITAGIEDLMKPLNKLKLPVTEISLTLTLSLRFIPLVLEEIQNLIRSVRTRAINWKKLGFKQTSQVWLIVVERLLENLLLRAYQIASAMKVRGFTTADQHRVEWHDLKLKVFDWIVLISLGLFWWIRLVWGGQS
ncbi:CbiQ family ECF transporter T component [Okeania sp.]|uniref:energy-coupling factor transporter transmembrane component T family protein n=1 Tax=Okeania sp. TaxID=3100323 RepID=UPI002B4AEF2F|nr:CbiQ family ECF transporter T component [Okeania sp.]MEB3342397.1 CbiQ family ECF transporter T component [Okeania sp.]